MNVAAKWVGILVVLGATVGLTVLVEHRMHGVGNAAHAEHGEEGEEGEQHHEEAGEHGKHEEGRVELSQEARKNAGIETAPAKAGRVDVTLTLPGEITINPERLAHVTPRVSGTVRETKKALGDEVKRGDVLALLESRELAEITREAAASTERYKLAEGTFKRLDGLYQDKVVSEKDYLAAKQALAEARIERDSAAAMLGAAGSGGAGTGYPLLAPIDGTVIEKHATVGEVLKGDTAAFVIADLSTLWVDATVYPRDLAKVAVGQKVRVRAEGIDAPVDGTISFIGATARGESRASQARVVIDRPGPSWRPGLFVTVDAAIQEIDAAVVVPEEAVQTIEGSPCVFVEEEGAFEARAVKLGKVGFAKDATAPMVELREGVKAGEPVVVKGAFILKAELGKGEAGHDH